MISVNEAWKLMMKEVHPLPTETCALEKSAGRVLRQSLTADRDYPPFNRVAMDGYALSFKAWQSGQTHFKIQEMQTAGQSPKVLRDPKACIEIMTGAKLPEGCDLVIRYEDTDRSGETAVIREGLDCQPFTNIHRQGVDCPKARPFSASVMHAPLSALAASFGHAKVDVARPARIAIIGTGDELVPIDSLPKDYQIRASNIHAVRMALESSGQDVILCQTLADQRERIHAAVQDALESADILLLSGGVSAGKTDFIPSVLQDCGVRQIFHKIAQRPGKPLWFGATAEGKVVFGLPGNPVSTLICFYRYALPFIQAMQGVTQEPEDRPRAELMTPRPAGMKLTHFVPVRLQYGADARMRAEATMHHGSGDFVSLSGTQGFVEIPGESEADFDPDQKYFTFYSW